MDKTDRESQSLATYVKLSRAVNSVDKRIMMHKPLPAGMSVTQFGVLEALLHRGELTHHDVAEKILKTQGNITIVVDKLVKAGYLERRRCEVDRRRVFLHLTSEGREVAEQAFDAMRRAITSEMAVLELDELVELSRLCRKLGTLDGS